MSFKFHKLVVNFKKKFYLYNISQKFYLKKSLMVILTGYINNS